MPARIASPLGSPVPSYLLHAVSVSLPTWQDNVDYEEGAKRVIDVMKTGYPRFFIHRSIQKLAAICEEKFGSKDERCMVFPSNTYALAARDFIIRLSSSPASSSVRIVNFFICPETDSTTKIKPPHGGTNGTNGTNNGTSTDALHKAEQRISTANLYITFFPASDWPLAKSLWQHTGTGISSRFAEHCLRLLNQYADGQTPTPTPTQKLKPNHAQPHAQKETDSTPPKSPIHGRNRHYSKRHGLSHSRTASFPPAPASASSIDYVSTNGATTNGTTTKTVNAEQKAREGEDGEESATIGGYLEERYARNLHQNAAADAKRSLRRRIAGILVREGSCSNGGSPTRMTYPSPYQTVVNGSGGCGAPIIGPSTRGVANITEDDVFLFQGGMCAIWHTHQLLLKTLGSRKSVCWGFPYVDTLKILQKWGPGCHFFGHGNEFNELEALLQSTSTSSTSPDQPILALFCEVTSNPLLRTPDLKRLRALADKYHFAIVVDETIGNFANVEVLPYSDVVCSSLTKIFSGETNVMGGGLILNPQGQFYSKLKPALQAMYEDVYWDEDAIFLERNSRDFEQRVHAINRNAELICDLLHSRSVESQLSKTTTTTTTTSSEPNGSAHTVTKGASNGTLNGTSHSSSLEHSSTTIVKKVYYPKWITNDTYNEIKTPDGGYGGLFSVTFTSPLAAQAFFDGLGCEKGPSLGTNFTLACPFVILAHYTELEWVKQFGVDPYLVRVSVGLESPEVLVGWIEGALRNAEEAVRKGGMGVK